MIPAAPVIACHGNGISRVCNFPGSVRLEAVTYEPNDVSMAGLYVAANYYRYGSFFFYGDNTCYDYWRCVHGLYEGGDASNY